MKVQDFLANLFNLYISLIWLNVFHFTIKIVHSSLFIIITDGNMLTYRENKYIFSMVSVKQIDIKMQIMKFLYHQELNNLVHSKHENDVFVLKCF